MLTSEQLQQQHTKLATLSGSCAGAGVLKTLLLYPMELAYTRLAADATPRGQPTHYFGLLHCMVQVAPLSSSMRTRALAFAETAC